MKGCQKMYEKCDTDADCCQNEKFHQRCITTSQGSRCDCYHAGFMAKRQPKELYGSMACCRTGRDAQEIQIDSPGYSHGYRYGCPRGKKGDICLTLHYLPCDLGLTCSGPKPHNLLDEYANQFSRQGVPASCQ